MTRRRLGRSILDITPDVGIMNNRNSDVSNKLSSFSSSSIGSTSSSVGSTSPAWYQASLKNRKKLDRMNTMKSFLNLQSHFTDRITNVFEELDVDLSGLPSLLPVSMHTEEHADELVKILENLESDLVR